MRPSTTPRVCTLVATALAVLSACSSDRPMGPELSAGDQRATGAPLADLAVAAGTHFVSTTGSDSNPGTEARPWRTIRQSLTRLKPGQRLYVRGGTYKENIK